MLADSLVRRHEYLDNSAWYGNLLMRELHLQLEHVPQNRRKRRSQNGSELDIWEFTPMLAEELGRLDPG